MSDTVAVVCGILLALTSSIALASSLADARPAWSSRRVSAIAAAPLPAVLALPCLWLFADALMSSKTECGVDACGMAAMVAVFGMIAAAACCLVGMVAAVLIVRWKR